MWHPVIRQDSDTSWWANAQNDQTGEANRRFGIPCWTRIGARFAARRLARRLNRRDRRGKPDEAGWHW